MNSEDQQQPNRQGDEQGVTRRRILQVLGAAAAAATLEAETRDRSASAPTAAPGKPAAVSAAPVGLHPVTLGAKPFSLTAVRLLDGPFKDAQERAGKYLLSLSPDGCCTTFASTPDSCPKGSSTAVGNRWNHGSVSVARGTPWATTCRLVH